MVKKFTHTYLTDSASELDSFSKETFVQAWSSILNNNENLNLQWS